MPRLLACPVAVLTLAAPALAQASGFAIDLGSAQGHGVEPASEIGAEAGAVDPLEDAGAEAEGPAPDGDAVDDAGDPGAAPAPAAEPADATAAARTGRGEERNRHAIGVRTGLTVVPTWVLSGFLASHTNAMCREEVGDFAAERGVTKMQGCNFFVGGEYIFRKSPVFDIVATAGWQKMRTPDGIWLDADECDSNGNNCNLSAADYTEVDVSFAFIEADFIGRFPVIKTRDVELGIGGGGGIGLGILTGAGVLQTPIGPLSETQAPQDQGTCNSVADFSDLRRCSPHYGADADLEPELGPMQAQAEWSDPGSFPFVRCSKDSCNKRDMELMGGRVKSSDVPPVIPVVNLILSTRLIVKDVWSIDLRGGWNTGFYFGGAMAYHFSGKAK